MLDRLAISNIAWNPEEEAAIFRLLRERGVQNLEVAPTKLWPKPLEVNQAEAEQTRRNIERSGFRIASMQALLFGREDLLLFGSPEQRAQLGAYLKEIIQRGAWLGAKALVFGSPRNRKRGEKPMAEAMQSAADFFREAGDYAAAAGTSLVFEANAPQYGCDFVTTSDEAMELVRRADSEGFRLHLDTGNMEMAGENVAGQIEKLAPAARHFHLSAPQLGVPTPPKGFLARLGGYKHIVSIEMRRTEAPESAIKSVLDALVDAS